MTKKKYKWHEKSFNSYYVEAETGRIIGQYSSVSLSDDVFHAQVHSAPLGNYISEKCAKEAIEKKIAQNDVLMKEVQS